MKRITHNAENGDSYRYFWMRSILIVLVTCAMAGTAHAHGPSGEALLAIFGLMFGVPIAAALLVIFLYVRYAGREQEAVPLDSSQVPSDGQYAEERWPPCKLATTALILSLIGVVFTPLALAGVICGHMAIERMKKIRTRKNWNRAVAGLAVGYCSLVTVTWIFIGLRAFL